MIVNKYRIFSKITKSDVIAQRGGGLVEVLLALVIVSVAAPFMYSMISDTTHMIHDMAVANDILSLREGVSNFVRINQDLWPETAQIKMSPEELAEFSDGISSGFIDKYTMHGGSIIDVYLVFDLDMDARRAARVAANVGPDAALVSHDGVAYGETWAVTAPNFQFGNLVYKISKNLTDFDTSRFLHRSGQDNLNVMERDLNMNSNNVYSVGGLDAKSIRVRNLDAAFVNAETLDARNVYFSSGANMNGDNVQIGTLRASGDINGFRNIETKKLNGSTFSVTGRVIADRATVNNSVNVARNLSLKSSSVKTIGGFTGITAGSVYAPYISTNEIVFYGDFGLTVSGELLMSSNPPIKIGGWAFPSATPPSFAALNLTRAKLPAIPNADEFKDIITNGWQTK